MKALERELVAVFFRNLSHKPGNLSHKPGNCNKLQQNNADEYRAFCQNGKKIILYYCHKDKKLFS